MFIDVDGVLLGKKNQNDIHHCMAAGSEEFIDYALTSCDCYWLTSHCKGDADPVMDYLLQYTSTSLHEKLRLIKPTTYKTFKTEALHGDFLWIDDSPTMFEINYLEQLNQIHRWLHVDTRKDYFGLQKLMPDIQCIVNKGFRY